MNDDIDDMLIFYKAARVEVIDEKGRAYVNTTLKDVTISVQDEGRTVKIFVRQKDK